MPLLTRGPKTLWFYSGVFLFLCAFVIMDTAESLPLAICLPSLYAILTEQLNKRATALVIAGVPLLFTFMPGLRLGVVMCMCLIACGLLLHLFLRRGYVGLAVFMPSLLIFLLIAAGIFHVSSLNNIPVQKMISQWVGNVMSQVSSIYAQNLSKQIYDDFMMTRTVIEQRFVQLFWGVLASFIVSIMWVNLLIAAGINKTVQLRCWRSPDWMVGFFILASVLILMEYDIPHALGLNLMIVVSQVYFFQGLGIVAGAMMSQNWGKFIRLVIYILILTQIYIMIGVAALGLFDTWFNFRKAIRNTEGDKT